MLLFIGIVLSIFTSLFGLIMLGYGALLGFAGMGPDGSVDSWWFRAAGVASFFYGIVCLTPVLAFSRRSLIIAYVSAALVTSVASAAFFLADKSVIKGPWDLVLMVLLYMLCPAMLAGIAFRRTMDRTE
jgi:hypothetical protein